MSADVSFEVASQTKLMTTLAVLALVDEGRLCLTDALTAYVPSERFKSPILAAQSTIDDCLRHCAGFGHMTSRRGMWRPLHATGLSALRGKGSTCLASLDGPIESMYEPRSRHQYSNVGVSILAEIVQNVSGVEYAEAVRALVLGPLGMSSTSIGARCLSISRSS